MMEMKTFCHHHHGCIVNIPYEGVVYPENIVLALMSKVIQTFVLGGYTQGFRLCSLSEFFLNLISQLIYNLLQLNNK